MRVQLSLLLALVLAPPTDPGAATAATASPAGPDSSPAAPAPEAGDPWRDPEYEHTWIAARCDEALGQRARQLPAVVAATDSYAVPRNLLLLHVELLCALNAQGGHLTATPVDSDQLYELALAPLRDRALLAAAHRRAGHPAPIEQQLPPEAARWRPSMLPMEALAARLTPTELIAYHEVLLRAEAYVQLEIAPSVATTDVQSRDFLARWAGPAGSVSPSGRELTTPHEVLDQLTPMVRMSAVDAAVEQRLVALRRSGDWRQLFGGDASQTSSAADS